MRKEVKVCEQSLHMSIEHILITFVRIVSKTLGGDAERLDGSANSPTRQETASIIYHVIEGSGSTYIGDEVLTWKRGDTFCVPSWYKYQHFANAGETVYFYRYDDRPMMKALGFYRSEGVEQIEKTDA